MHIYHGLWANKTSSACWRFFFYIHTLKPVLDSCSEQRKVQRCNAIELSLWSSWATCSRLVLISCGFLIDWQDFLSTAPCWVECHVAITANYEIVEEQGNFGVMVNCCKGGSVAFVDSHRVLKAGFYFRLSSFLPESSPSFLSFSPWKYLIIMSVAIFLNSHRRLIGYWFGIV